MSERIPVATINIFNGSAQVMVMVFAGMPIFIVGGNGCGKSALVHHLVSQLQGRNVVYIPGSRSNSFDQESLNMNPASRRQFRINLTSWDQSWDTRWRNMSGSSRNEKAIHDLQAAEIQFLVDATDNIKRRVGETEGIRKLQARTSPIDRVNNILEQANLPTRVQFLNGELQAAKGGVAYSIARMSDGERAALILTAEVVSAISGSIFVLDEPELHLHRSITLPLISVMIKERQDCAFLVSTHELDLPTEWLDSKTLIVRGCEWEGVQPRSWSFDVISSHTPIPEELRLDILGSRKQIIFVEGRPSSLDKPLYSLLLPTATVTSRNTCKEVRQAVQGLRANQSIHHISAYGIVDNDGLDHEFTAALATDCVFALPVFSVEALYYSRVVLNAIAEQKKSLGFDPDALLRRADTLAIQALKVEATLVHLAARISEQALRNAALSSIPDRDSLIASGASEISLSIPSPYPNELATITMLAAAGNIDAVVERYPVRESGILAALAKGLGFENRVDYERAVLARVAVDSVLKSALQSKLNPLPSILFSNI